MLWSRRLLLHAIVASCWFFGAARLGLADELRQNLRASRMLLGEGEPARVVLAGGLYWVLALPAAFPSSPAPGGGTQPGLPYPYLESHSSACSRVGLVPTSTVVVLPRPWNLEFLQDLSDGLNQGQRVQAVVDSCCTASAWCALTSNGTYQCSSHLVGRASYTNFGWMTASSFAQQPLYSCNLPPTQNPRIAPPAVVLVRGAAPAVRFGDRERFFPPSALRYTTQEAVALPMRLAVDGYDLGRDPNEVDVRVGSLACTNPVICDRFCESCSSSSDCDSGKVCVTVATSKVTKSVCVMLCSATEQLCPCGGECFSLVSTSRVRYVCLNRQIISDAADLCSSSARAEFRPADGQGDSRIECDMPKGFCPAAGNLSVTVTTSPDSMRSSASTWLASNTSITARVASGSSVPSDPSKLSWPWGGGGNFDPAHQGAAAGFSPASPQWPYNVSLAYSVPLPIVSFEQTTCTTDEDCQAENSDGICSFLKCQAGCCVPKSTGRCLTDSGALTPQYIAGERQVLPLPASVARFAPFPSVPVGSLPSDTVSPVSHADDVPLEAIPLNFSLPFYARFALRMLHLSPNGELQISSTPPCGNVFANSSCTVSSGYRGVIAPFLADLDPSASSSALVVWRMSNVSLCVRWITVPTYSSEPGPSVPKYTFIVCIFTDGGVRFHWETIPVIPSAADSWFSGVRDVAESSQEYSSGALDAARGFIPDSDALGNVSIADDTTVGLSRTGVLSGGVASLCSVGTVACVTPRCGMIGTRLRIRWAGFGCGIGFGAPRDIHLQCVFGGATAVNATIVSSSVHSGLPFEELECVVPTSLPPPSASGTTIPVNLVLQVPLSSQFAAASLARDMQSWRLEGANQNWAPVTDGLGIGTTAGVGTVLPSTSNYGFIDLAVVGALAVDNSTVAPVFLTTDGLSPRSLSASQSRAMPQLVEVAPWSSAASSSLSKTSHRRKLGETIGDGIVIATHELMFTVLPASSNLTCGCDLSPVSSCDRCGECLRLLLRDGKASHRFLAGVCNGGDQSVDCAGVCLGTAAVDDCGVCAGGSTGITPNRNKDCHGICFGSNTACPSPSPPIVSPSPSKCRRVLVWSKNLTPPPPRIAAAPSPSKQATPDEPQALYVLAMVALALLSCLFLVCIFMVGKHFVRGNHPQVEPPMDVELARRHSQDEGLSDEQLALLEAVPYSDADTKLVEARNSECIISLEAFRDGDLIVRLPCEHQITHHLAMHYFVSNSRCPMCRFDVAEWATNRLREEAEHAETTLPGHPSEAEHASPASIMPRSIDMRERLGARESPTTPEPATGSRAERSSPSSIAPRSLVLREAESSPREVLFPRSSFARPARREGVVNNPVSRQ
jgi:hypothetical protein